MKACNAQADDKKGDERKTFMSSCLKAGAPLTEQEKMKKSNADASAKAGWAER
jgi:psiF repeat